MAGLLLSSVAKAGDRTPGVIVYYMQLVAERAVSMGIAFDVSHWRGYGVSLTLSHSPDLC